MKLKHLLLIQVAIGLVLAVIVFVYWYGDLGHAPVESMPHLHGTRIEDVIQELGEPDDELAYTIGNSPDGELRNPLSNFYRPDRPDSRDVQIKELWWKHSRFTVVAWFTTWETGGLPWTCRWKEGVQF